MKKITIVLVIFLSCMTGLLYAQVFTQDVQTQINNDQTIITRDQNTENTYTQRIANLNAEIQSAQSDLNTQQQALPVAQTDDAQALQAQQANAVVSQPAPTGT